MEHYHKRKARNSAYTLSQAMVDAKEPYRDMKATLFHARKVVVKSNRDKAKKSTGAIRAKLDDRADRIEAVAYGDVMADMKNDY